MEKPIEGCASRDNGSGNDFVENWQGSGLQVMQGLQHAQAWRDLLQVYNRTRMAQVVKG